MNLQDAAGKLGVHYQTAYRWVRRGELVATKVGGSYDVSDSELTRFQALRMAPVLPPERLVVRDWGAQRSRFETALRNGEELIAREILDRLKDGNVTFLEICSEVVAPSMRAIGDAWHRKELSIAEEHRATAIVERLLSRLATHPRGRPRGTAVVTTTTNELHGLPALMAALVLREDKWRVHHLGPNTPYNDLFDMCKSVEADLVVLSTTYAPDSSAVRTATQRLTDAGFRVLVGAPGSTLQKLRSDARTISPD
jgi:MerR family transcriptional regulator, light-induced transcriptional regulator